MKYFSCAYYPETWGVERVAVDAELMRGAGINLVRIGEFAWSKIEPKEGMFALDWLHKSIELLAVRGINVLMCTPTAAPPAWLTYNYPETMVCDKHGHPAGHGVRQQGCYTSPKFRELCRKVTKEMTAGLAGHENIIAWQIDNELGCSMYGMCECDCCQYEFRKWLKRCYGSLEELNQRWGNEFWSMEYTDWKEIRLGHKRDNLSASRVLDSTRFHAEMIISFAGEQAELIRENGSRWMVTTNNAVRTDLFQLFESLDVVGADQYFQGKKTAECTFAMDLHRSLKKGQSFWLVETGIIDDPLDHRRFRANFWSAFAHGAEMFSVFRWRYPGSGQEQNGDGVLTHSGAARHNYQMIKKTFNEFHSLKEHFKDLPLPRSEIAIVHDYQGLWVSDSGRLADNIRHSQLILDCYEKLSKRGMLSDFIPANADITDYRLLILPVQINLSEDFSYKIKKFVEGGGLLFSLGPLGIFDENANYLTEPHPEIISKIFGVRFYDGLQLPLKSGESVTSGLSVSGILDKSTVSGRVDGWVGDLDLEGAQTLLKIDEGIYKGQPVLLTKSLGKGKTIHLASTHCDAELFDKIMAFVLNLAKFEDTLELPSEVETVMRGKLIFFINRNRHAERVKLRHPAAAILGDCNDCFVDLPPYGVAIINSSQPV